MKNNLNKIKAKTLPLLMMISLLLLIGLTSCDNSNNQSPDVNKTDSSSDKTENSSYGIFDNIASIKVIVNGTDDNGYYPCYLTFNSKEAINTFVDTIHMINDNSEIELKYGSFEGKIDDIEELKKRRLFNGISLSSEDEKYLGISCVSLLIEYDDNRKPSKVCEFIDGYTDVFEDGDGIKIVYDSQITYLENKDDLIINEVVQMIKNHLHYVQIYDYDGNYEYTRFLNPLHVETDEYTIESDHFFQAFLTDYWIDYISKHNFTIYKYNKIIGELPEPDGEITQDIYLDDENGNIFQYAYDRKDNMRCTVDKENDRKYYCEYESE